MSSSSSSPCAACKFLRRKCTEECVFASYFPPDQPQKFAHVHKVFGASNVAKLLNELCPDQREDAVNSLFYEAESRLRDPVYGCVGLISILQHHLKQLHHDLDIAQKELASYIGPQALLPVLQPLCNIPLSSSSSMMTPQHHNTMPMMTIPTAQPVHGQLLLGRQHQQQQQQQQHPELFRAYNFAHHQNQQTLAEVETPRLINGGLDSNSGSVTVTGFNQMLSSSLALGSLDSPANNDPSKQLHHPHGAELYIPTQSGQPQTQSAQQQPPETQTQTQPISDFVHAK